MDQPSLFDRPEGTPSRELTLDQRFTRFHLDNPAVYAELAVLARKAKSRRATG